MTLPSERTRAILRAGDFLLRLCSPYGNGIKGIRREVRQEARSILRHFPGWWDFMPDDGRFDKEAAAQWGEAQRDSHCFGETKDE